MVTDTYFKKMHFECVFDVAQSRWQCEHYWMSGAI